jgi:integrase/recombinase XerD
MNTLRQAIGEYLEMRRALGFKLREAGKGLINFVAFLERHKGKFRRSGRVRAKTRLNG